MLIMMSFILIVKNLKKKCFGIFFFFEIWLLDQKLNNPNQQNFEVDNLFSMNNKPVGILFLNAEIKQRIRIHHHGNQTSFVQNAKPVFYNASHKTFFRFFFGCDISGFLGAPCPIHQSRWRGQPSLARSGTGSKDTRRRPWLRNLNFKNFITSPWQSSASQQTMSKLPIEGHFAWRVLKLAERVICNKKSEKEVLDHFCSHQISCLEESLLLLGWGNNFIGFDSCMWR